eukprot:8979871-Alexandrium_andersonii.AAC.1
MPGGLLAKHLVGHDGRSASRCSSVLARTIWTEASALFGAAACGWGAAGHGFSHCGGQPT